ncbi:HD domain-containing protein [Alicyclobacillus fodiniaquatilis]|uniref:HD domain-containing protein n=1 Tax=Alicyclobacillus fodiniaquatilis TaxID=1661150 RepID=A0ABW4JG20_9BACL
MQFDDVIHGVIQIEHADLQDLIHTAAFQRLQKLKQQGNTYRRCATATHHRFAHSIGVYNNMRKLLTHMQASGQYIFTDYERTLALTAALLHDIGHGPFSHCFEQITDIHHEVWTTRIINEDTDIRLILDRTPGLRQDVIDIMRRQGKFPVVETLLFSPVGADKLDYLNRDLYHSNLDNPLLDLDTLIAGLQLMDGQLLVKADRLSAIEKLVQIKRDLFETVFGHPAVVSYDLLLKMIFKRAMSLSQHGQLTYMPAVLSAFLQGDKTWPVEDYEALTDDVVMDLLLHWQQEKDSLLAELATRFTTSSDHPPLRWIDIQDETLFNTVDHDADGYQVMLYASDVKYGLYQGGILIEIETGAKDVIDISTTIQSLSISSYPTHFLFYREKAPGI